MSTNLGVVLPDELILLVLSNLDVPELLAVSRTSRNFRRLALDPRLHALRLRLASLNLSSFLPYRAPLAALRPPRSNIYLTPQASLQRSLSRSLLAIRLNRRLARRPDPSRLVSQGILPAECCARDSATGKVRFTYCGGAISWRLMDTRRRVEREQLKDGLRGWIGDFFAGKVQKESERWDYDRNTGRISVRGLVRRWSNLRLETLSRESGRGKRMAAKATSEPTRAHVLGLRRFWENLAKGQRREVTAAL